MIDNLKIIQNPPEDKTMSRRQRKSNITNFRSWICQIEHQIETGILQAWLRNENIHAIKMHNKWGVRRDWLKWILNINRKQAFKEYRKRSELGNKWHNLIKMNKTLLIQHIKLRMFSPVIQE